MRGLKHMQLTITPLSLHAETQHHFLLHLTSPTRRGDFDTPKCLPWSCTDVTQRAAQALEGTSIQSLKATEMQQPGGGLGCGELGGWEGACCRFADSLALLWEA